MDAERYRAYMAQRREDARLAAADAAPAGRLRDELAFRRDGRDGLGTGRTFAEVWPECVRRALAGMADADWWRPLFIEQEDAWRRAYDRGAQLPCERALVRLFDPGRTELVLEPEPEELPPPPARTCAACGGPMDGRAPQARTCSDECAHKRKLASERAAKPTHTTTPRRELSLGAGESSRERMAA